MPKKAPTAKAGALGAKLREIRRQKRLSMADVAEKLRWSESTLSRAETGRRNLPSEDVAALLAVYGVTGSERDALVAMARTIDEPGWWETEFRGLPSLSVALAKYEADALRITNWAPLLVPGLLQTMEFTRAYMLANGIGEENAGKRLMGRQRRQAVLDKVEYHAFIAEQVLHQKVGGPLTMLNQLRHLQRMADRVEIRVISGDVDAHSGLIGPFIMLEFADTPPVVHVELLRSGVFLNGRADTDPYRDSLDQLQSLSLDAGESVRRIADAADQLESETA